MESVLLFFAIFSIASQVPHAYYVFKIGSNLSEKAIKWNWFTPKNIQSAIFSLIIANAIMFTVLLKMHWVALIWVFVEIYINRLYVRHSREQKESKKRTNGNPVIVSEWEKKASNLIAWLIPACIYVFSLMYVEYDRIIEFFNN